MRITWKCKCMAMEAELDVPDRRPYTQITDWMAIVGQCISFDHKELSPECTETSVEYVKVPLEEGAPIGGKAEDHG